MRTDQISQALVGQRERYGDAARDDLAPPFGEMPEGEDQPFVDPLVVGDGQRHGQRVRSAGATTEELQPQLRPRRDPDHQAMVENGKLRGSSTDQPTSAWTWEPSSSQLQGRSTSPGPISSTHRLPRTSTSRLTRPSMSMKPRW